MLIFPMTIYELHRLWDKNNKGKSAASEHDLQVQCVRWFRYQYPLYACLLMAIPNGGLRNSIVAAKLKAEGVIAGTPDLFLAVPCKGSHGLWIEMKNGKAGRVSDKQSEMMSELTQKGYDCKVVRSFDEFVDTIEKYLK